MKVAILAGGMGTRISEESQIRPKPMVEIGGKPIIWHIMKTYSRYGFDDFIICAGYKQEAIKDYFENYYLHNCDVSYDFVNGSREILNQNTEQWRVTVIDTGLNTMTGGRIKRIEKYVGGEPFMLTYGDGVSDVNISSLLDYHRRSNKTLTLTAIQVGSKFGNLRITQSGVVESFSEKSNDEGSWINGGYMVANPEIFDYISGDETVFEKDPIESVCRNGQLAAYKHHGFWKCMDTLRDKNELESMARDGKAPWIVW